MDHIAKVTGRVGGLGNVGRMTDEQLIALRSIFQAIDSNNNGSITPSLVTEFYKQVRHVSMLQIGQHHHTQTHDRRFSRAFLTHPLFAPLLSLLSASLRSLGRCEYGHSFC